MTAQLLSPGGWDGIEKHLGDIAILVSRSPVSHQAGGAVKRELTDCIRTATRGCQFVITSDVTAEIEWYISERERYESDAVPDVDNIIKPILDALSGPEGLMVNDCQIQSITSYWMGLRSDRQEIMISVRPQFDPFWHAKSAILFVQFGRALCFPIDSTSPPEAQLIILECVERMLQTRDQFSECGYTDSIAGAVMPLQRLFHRTRISGFPVRMLEDVRRDLRRT
jgi:Holliday junction resolvase RusA-like endonuclease